MADSRRRRALITRPQEDAADIAVALARREITPVLAPMMAIAPADVDIEADVETAQALLFTSRNGVRAFCRLSHRRDKPVYAVGDATAALARDNAFVSVESADGDTNDLARLAIDKLLPGGGALFHAAGATVAGDLSGLLTKAGFHVVRRTLYSAEPVAELSADTRVALRNGDLDYVLFFSPRTARIFVDLISSAGLGASLSSLVAVCLSDAVASELDTGAWREIRVAERPATDALVATLEASEPASPADGVPGTSDNAAPSDVRPWGGPAIKTEDGVPAEADTGGGDEDESETPPSREQEILPPEQPLPEFLRRDMPAMATRDDKTGDNDDERTDNDPADSDMTNADDTAVSNPAPARQAAARRGGAPAVAWTLVVILIAVGAAYGTLPMWRDNLPASVRDRLAGGAPENVMRFEADLNASRERSAAAIAQLEARNAELQQRIDGLESALGSATSRLAATDAVASKLSALEQKLADLQTARQTDPRASEARQALGQRIAGLEAAVKMLESQRSSAIARDDTAAQERAAAAEKTSSTIAGLTARLAELETRLTTVRRSATTGKTESIAFAAAQLRDALSRAVPYAAELATLKKLADGDPEIAAALAPIAGFAAKGIPSRADLFARLPAMVDAAAAAIAAPVKDGWVDRAVAKLKGFVRVRRVDGHGGGADATLARAEIAARRGDLLAAADALSALNGPAAAAVSPWVAAARSRLAAESAGAALNRIILTGLAAGG